MRLLPITPHMADSVADGMIDVLPPGLAISESLDFIIVSAIATAKLYGANGYVPPWIVYLAVMSGSNTVVGACGFKAPCQDGTVELACFSFPPFQGRGHGSAMVAALLDIARRQPVVRQVSAQTKRRDGPACQILRGRGFRWSEPVDDPDEGPVWRWIWTAPGKADPNGG